MDSKFFKNEIFNITKNNYNLLEDLSEYSEIFQISQFVQLKETLKSLVPKTEYILKMDIEGYVEYGTKMLQVQEYFMTKNEKINLKILMIILCIIVLIVAGKIK